MKPLYHLLLDWSIRCFGKEHVFNKPVRAVRLAEEAVEYAQSHGVPIEQMHKLIDVVYSRPVGEADQELGGVFVTAIIASIADNQDPDTCFLNEMRRIMAKSPEHFHQRNQEKLDLGLVGHV